MASLQSRCIGKVPRSTGRAPSLLRGQHPRPPSATSSGLRDADQPTAPPRLVVETGLLGDRRAVVPLGGGANAAAVSLEQDAAIDNGNSGSPSSSQAGSNGPLAAVRAFFLPSGWPSSVTSDYLNYQLATVPAHITGWMSHSLATSSMIQALGVVAGPGTVVASSAAIKWILKDGLGAAGRLIVGGRLSSVFDEDPKRWRMVAEGVSTVGLALEIATQIYPAYFVALAGAGTLCKSMAKGMGTPCFRIIQTHFSATNNVGDVAAKEEVWEVAAQLLGLASSVVALQLLKGSESPDAVVPVWAAVHALHVGLRYAALNALRFPYPNQKRAAVMTSRHVSTGRVPSIEECNLGEQVLLPPSVCRPRVVYGCTLDQALGLGSSTASTSGTVPSSHGSSSGSSSKSEQLAELVQLYHGERYLLTWHSGTSWVLVLEGAGKLDLLRAMWQAAWLEHHQHQVEQQQHQQQIVQQPQQQLTQQGLPQQQQQQQQHAPAANGSSDSGKCSMQAADSLAASLAALRQQWPDFVQQAQQQGWLLEKAVLPQGSARLRLE